VLTEGTGEVPIEVPRDREGPFEPQIVRKRQRRLSGVDEMVLSLYAKGMTTGEIWPCWPRRASTSARGLRPGQPGGLIGVSNLRWILLSRPAASQRPLRGLGTKWESPALATALYGSVPSPVHGRDLRNYDSDLVAGIGMRGWGSRGRRFKSGRPDAGQKAGSGFQLPALAAMGAHVRSHPWHRPSGVACSAVQAC
jgi:hypothetical protein